MNKQLHSINGYIQSRAGMLPRLFAILSRRRINPVEVTILELEPGVLCFSISVLEECETVRRLTQQVSKQEDIWAVSSCLAITETIFKHKLTAISQ